jgi:hypothetical protein
MTILNKNNGFWIMLRQISFSLLFFSLAFTLNATEEIRYYNVEIVIFEHENADKQHEEDWTAPRLEEDSEQAELTHELGQSYVMEAESPYKPELMFTPVPEQEYQLTEQARKIDESSSRRVLMHTAWRQPGLSRQQAIRVLFKKPLGDAQTAATATSNPPATLATPGSPALQQPPYLEGGIKVMLSRYLHVDANILYHKQLPAIQVISPESEPANPANEYIEDSARYTVYQMNQLRRRMRSSELHYIDHPVIGMLVYITPHELPQEPEVETKTP